jgi:hypothetical protein
LLLRLCQAQSFSGSDIWSCLPFVEGASYFQRVSEKMESHSFQTLYLSREKILDEISISRVSLISSLIRSSCRPIFGTEILLLIPRFYDVALDG